MWRRLPSLRSLRAATLLALLTISMLTTRFTDQLTAAPEKPLAWAYGKHLVAGNIVLQDRDAATGETTLFVALGEGEWDGVESIEINGVAIPASEYNFHPGKPGEVGTGGVDGDQKIDEFFPNNLTGLTFSHTAYVAIKTPNDPNAPSPGFDVRGVYRTKKVNIYDAAGVLQSYSYSANPAWCCLDVLLRAVPESRIDFPSFKAAADYCDADITINAVVYNRFECHVAVTQYTDIGEALKLILSTCRGRLFEDQGKIFLSIDQIRSAQHTFKRDNIAFGSFSHQQRELRNAPTDIIIEFRDLENGFRSAAATYDLDDQDEIDVKDRPLRIHIGNSYQQQAARLARYFRKRTLEAVTLVKLTGLQDSLHVQVGDRVDFDLPLDAPHDLPKAYDVLEISEGSGGEREFLLSEYLVDAFSDSGPAPQLIEGGVIVGNITAPAPPVTNVSCSENKFVSPEDGTVWSEVTVSFDDPVPLGTYKGVEVWARRLDAMDQPIEEYKLYTKGRSGPLIFRTEPTGDKLELRVPSVNLLERVNDVATAPQCVVTLDAQPSAPAAVSDLWCQQLPDALRLSWDEGLESNLEGYQVADAGGLTPANDADLLDRHVIAVVKADRGAGARAVWDFREVRYSGTSDGTTITLSSDASSFFWNVNQHVIGGVGKPITIVKRDGTEEEHSTVGNTERAIDFSPGTIPTGEVSFYLRGLNGQHHLYVRPFNTTKQKGLWRPAPPSVLDCFPYDRFGTKDTGVTAVRSSGAINTAESWFRTPPLRLALVGATDQSGGLIVHIAAYAALEVDPAAVNAEAGTTETNVTVTGHGMTAGDWLKNETRGQGRRITAVVDANNFTLASAISGQVSGDSLRLYSFDKSPKQNINSIRTIEVEITSSEDGETGLGQTVFSFVASNEQGNYFFLSLPPLGSRNWVWHQATGFIAFPNEGIDSVRARLENSYGWSPWNTIAAHAPPGTKPWFTSFGEVQAARLQAPNVSDEIYPNLAHTRHFTIEPAADTTIKKPEYRSKNGTLGGGSGALVGDTFKTIVKQGATAFRITFDTAYKGVSSTKHPVPLLPNTYAVHDWLIEGSDEITCVGYFSSE